jgi:hypothetical protein
LYFGLGLGSGRQKGTLEVSIPKMGSVARKIRLSEQALCNLRTLPGVPALINAFKAEEGRHLQKRFYILFVARGDDGQLRKISIPVHYLYVFVVGAAIGFLSLTGIASSYTRMLLKVSRYNELRTEKEQLKDRYSKLEEVAKERDVQVASLGSIASEVSALYGLKSQPTLVTARSSKFRTPTSLLRWTSLAPCALPLSPARPAVGISLGNDSQRHDSRLVPRQLRPQSLAG